MGSKARQNHRSMNSPSRVKGGRPSRICLLALCASIAVGTTLSSQERAESPEFVQHRDTVDRLVGFPTVSALQTGRWTLGDTVIHVTRGSTHVEVRATARSRQRVKHLPLSSPHARIVFDRVQVEFFKLHPSIRVDAVDPKSVELLGARLGAVGSDTYPALGYSAIQLEVSADPFAAVRIAEASGLATHAEVVFVQPPNDPM